MVKSMHLINIQSWKDEKIEFSDELVNVVSARSEKGKTVLYKVFYQMVFPNYYKFGSRNDLIRRTCSYGEVEFELYNFTKILFHCEHKEQWFRMKKACDDDWVTYYQSNCPNEIINELGLVVDYELQYILNIYIKDNQYPFINTTKTWNAVLFNQVFKNEKLDKVTEYLNSELKEITELQKTLQNQLNYKNLQNKQLEYKDIDKIKEVKKTVSGINKCYDVIDEISKVLVKYEEHLKTYEDLKDKVFDVVDIVDIKKLVITLKSVNKVTKDLEPNLNVIENSPDNVEIGDTVSGIRGLWDTIRHIQKHSDRVESQLVNYAKSVQGIKQGNSVKADVENIKELSCVIGDLSRKLKVFESKFVEQANICEEIKKVSSELEEVKSKIKICPTCKRPL